MFVFISKVWNLLNKPICTCRLNWLKSPITTNVIIALTTISIAATAWFQYFTLQDQLAEMKSSSDQTESLAKNTKILAKNAGKQATNTQILAGATQNQVTQLKSIVKTTFRSIKNTQIQFRSDQRPWVFVEKISFIKELAPAEGTKIEFTLINTGRTPAVNIRIKNECRIIMPGETVMDIKWADNDVLTIGAGMNIPGSFSEQTYLTQQLIDKIKSGIYQYYLIMDITYNDTFEGSDTHGIKECMQYFPSTKRGFKRCSGEDYKNYEIKNSNSK